MRNSTPRAVRQSNGTAATAVSPALVASAGDDVGVAALVADAGTGCSAERASSGMEIRPQHSTTKPFRPRQYPAVRAVVMALFPGRESIAILTTSRRHGHITESLGRLNGPFQLAAIAGCGYVAEGDRQVAAGRRTDRHRETDMRILIADDHRLIVEGVKLKLAELAPDIEFLVAMDVDELRRVIRDQPTPTLALIDLTMPGSHGNEHLVETMASLPGVPVLVLSGTEDSTRMRELLDLGVQGFIPKAYSPDVMLSAVRLVLSGGVYVPPMMLLEGSATTAGDATTRADNTTTLDERLRKLLTERQIDVLRLLSLGKPNKVIARDLGISEGTVKIHLAAIFRALNVRNRVEAVVASRRISGL
jgi:DNA-binding NarL/FixJ family response regulator